MADMVHIVVPKLPVLIAGCLIAALGFGLFARELRACRREGRSCLTGRPRA